MKQRKLLATLAAVAAPLAAVGVGVYIVGTNQPASHHMVSMTNVPVQKTGDESNTTSVSKDSTPKPANALANQDLQASGPSTPSANASTQSNTPSTPSTENQQPAPSNDSSTHPKAALNIPANAATRDEVAAALVQATGNATIQTDLKSDSGFVTVTQLDQAYWDFVGIPQDHAAYQPGGGDVTAWGTIVGLNRGMTGTVVTKQDLQQLKDNISAIQRGYEALGDGNYRLQWGVSDVCKSWGGTNETATQVSTRITEGYRFTNATIVHVGDGKLTLHIPGFSIGAHYQAVVHTMGAGSDLSIPNAFQVSTDNGATWQGAVMYNSQDAEISGEYTGGVTSAPAYVLVQPSGKNEDEIMLWGPTPTTNPVQSVSIDIQFHGSNVTVGQLTVPLS